MKQKSLIDVGYVRLKVEMINCVVESESSDDYLTSIHGKILYDEQVIGEIDATFVDVEGINGDVISLFEVLDATQDLHDYHGALFEADDSLKLLPGMEQSEGNILIIDAIKIEPKYKGRNLGLLVVRRLIKMFKYNTAMVVLRPHPMGDEKDVLALNETIGIEKLKKYWNQIFFKPVPGHEHFYYFPTWWNRYLTVEECPMVRKALKRARPRPQLKLQAL